MKYAIVEGKKTEAFKGGIGSCPSCKSEVIAKCGDVKINHWAHKGTRNCDVWWENETEWHRQWKNQFPDDWQEIVQFDSTGEKHIADVRTDDGWVLEFQHSYLKPDERIARNTFYPKLVWVIDGLRRKTDRTQFQKILDESSKVPVGNGNFLKINYPEESRLLREWMDYEVPVFFDFNESGKSRLWFLLPMRIKGEAYLMPFSRSKFIAVHNDNNDSGFDELVNGIIPKIRNTIISQRQRISNRSISILLRGTRTRPNRRRF